MTDRRELKSNGRVAHSSLSGLVEAEVFTNGQTHVVTKSTADICQSPNGIRDRQLLLGQEFKVLESRDGWCFGYGMRDGYVGYVAQIDLADPPDPAPNHTINVVRSFASQSPDVKDTDAKIDLSFGSRLFVQELDDDWARIKINQRTWFVPSRHVATITDRHDDPAAVAAMFITTPYIWGGNSAFGIDCSGLIQIAAHACDINCPGDSDQQAQTFGGLSLDVPFQRNDLFFWKGHVALALDGENLIHANARHMCVAVEPIDAAMARISASETGPLIVRGRLAS